MNEDLARATIRCLVAIGVRTFCVCPGGRNAELLAHLYDEQPRVEVLHFFDERAAAFFALGRARRDRRAVAVVTTSGTAVGELLPASMEAHYSGVPLILVTADRPKRFRGTGAPQACEQVGIFSSYVEACIDVDSREGLTLESWSKRRPLHLNVCLEEPGRRVSKGGAALDVGAWAPPVLTIRGGDIAQELSTFVAGAEHPLVLVGTLHPRERASVEAFLLRLRAPLYCEGPSGLRESHVLAPLQLRCPEQMEQSARTAGYPIDRVLRIGGMPTLRFWRDLEETPHPVLSLSEVPFSGLTHGECRTLDLSSLHEANVVSAARPQGWLAQDAARMAARTKLLHGTNEPALVAALSRLIPCGANVYLGNSMPIREWDLAATHLDRGLQITASRGLNGIDGQLSTFLGLCEPQRDNWAVLGDLTTLYDFSGLWAAHLTPGIRPQIVVINNSGGRIFERMFDDPRLQNQHRLDFAAFARAWGLAYERWTVVPEELSSAADGRLIELVPDEAETARFWELLA